MKPLFLYIIDRGESDCLAGLTPLEWLIRGAADTPYRVIDREEAATPVTGFRFVALIHTNTPLVTAEALLSLVKDLEKRGICGVEIGEGKLLSYEAFSRGDDPKGKITSPLTERTETHAARDRIERELYRKNAEFFAQIGAIIPDVDNVRIDAKSRLEKGAIIEPFTFIKESVVRGGARIGAFSELERAEIGVGAEIRRSVIADSVIGSGTTVGPFAYIRMNSFVGERCRIGDFVEVKKSTLGAGCKAAHLAYIGDAEVGERTNVGCGAVFANYNGREKRETHVGREVFIGANVNLVAPLKVGDGAYIAAATTVTKDVPDGAFVIGRMRAENKEKTT